MGHAAMIENQPCYVNVQFKLPKGSNLAEAVRYISDVVREALAGISQANGDPTIYQAVAEGYKDMSADAPEYPYFI